jgi:hypothetical protein
MAAYTFTLSISSDSPTEMASTVEALGKSLTALNVGEPGAIIEFPRGAASRDESKVWYAKHAAAFLDELTPDALRAVLFVADHAPSVPIETLSGELELGKGPALAGKLASIGWAVRRLSAPAPFRRVRDRYEMEPEVAAAVRSARPRAVRRAAAIQPEAKPAAKASPLRRSGTGSRRHASRP